MLSTLRTLSIALTALIFGAACAMGVSVFAQSVSAPNGLLGQSGIPNFAAEETNPGWTQNDFSCESGYTLRGYHYNHGSSNNAVWYVCVDSSLNPYSDGSGSGAGAGGGGGSGGGSGNRGWRLF